MSAKQFTEALVVSSRETIPDSRIFHLQLRIENFKEADFGPGKFIALKPRNGAAWVRPYTVAWTDAAKSEITLFIRTVGQENSNSRLYAKLKPGDKVEMSDPCGRTFELLPGIEKYLLVAGGTGQAALLPIARKIINSKKRLDFLIGTKNKSEVFGLDLLLDLNLLPQIICQEGSEPSGQATDLLYSSLQKDILKTAVIACGPKPMLKKVFDLCKQNGIPCLVSVEELMACGCNSCKGCAIKGNDGTFKQICANGPIFDAYWIDWEAFLREPTIQRAKKPLAKNPLAMILYGQGGRFLKMALPWTNGAGCLGEDRAEKGVLGVDTLITKAVTLHERFGNPMPRICELPGGNMLNSIGLANVGLARFLREKLPIWLATGKQIIVNVAGSTIEEFEAIFIRLIGVPIAAVEINVSCPNVKEGGMAFGTNPEITFQVVKLARLILPRMFLIVKLTPSALDNVAVAKRSKEGGADAFSLINTLKGMDIDLETLRPKIGKNYGGLSGPALLPVGLRMTSELYRSGIGLPIITGGGISSYTDALKCFSAGAKAVQVGTDGFVNERIFAEFGAEIPAYLERKGFSCLDDLSGAVELFK
jgi:dihydroorotate dehydrogenase (NAD+) catalytic subunit